MNAAKSPIKKITFTPKPSQTAKLENWIEGEGSLAEPGATPAAVETVPLDPMKRLTIDVAESLHFRVKSQCALRRKQMADVIREFLEREFPEA